MLRLSMLLSTLLLAACSSGAVSGLSLQVPTPTHLSAPTQALIATAAPKLKAAECLSQPEAAWRPFEPQGLPGQLYRLLTPSFVPT